MFTLLIIGYNGHTIYSDTFTSLHDAIVAGSDLYHGIYDYEVFDQHDTLVHTATGFHPYAHVEP